MGIVIVFIISGYLLMRLIATYYRSKIFKKSDIYSAAAFLPYVNIYAYGELCNSQSQSVLLVIVYMIRDVSVIISLVCSFVISTKHYGSASFDLTRTILIISLLLIVISIICSIVFSINMFYEFLCLYGEPKQWVILWVVCRPIAEIIFGHSSTLMPVMSTQEFNTLQFLTKHGYTYIQEAPKEVLYRRERSIIHKDYNKVKTEENVLVIENDYYDSSQVPLPNKE